MINRSAGRFPDGADTDSNCADFLLQAATTLPAGSAAGATNLKVAGVADFLAGQTILVDTGANQETAVIATVGTGGATTFSAGTAAGATVIPVATGLGFAPGQTITIDTGANQETAVLAAATGGGRGGGRITLSAPLARAHAAGALVSGSGITLTTALTKAHAAAAQITNNAPTPGAPNRFDARARK